MINWRWRLGRGAMVIQTCLAICSLACFAKASVFPLPDHLQEQELISLTQGLQSQSNMLLPVMQHLPNTKQVEIVTFKKGEFNKPYTKAIARDHSRPETYDPFLYAYSQYQNDLRQERDQLLLHFAPVLTKAGQNYLKQAASKGNPEALLQMGLLHLYGLGKVAQDDYKAFMLIAKAAATGYQPALIIRDMLIIKDIGVNKSNAVSRMETLQNLAAQGVAAAQYRLASWYLNEAAQTSFVMAAYWALQASRQGMVQAQYLLGNLLTQNLEHLNYPSDGLSFLIQAKRRGSTEAMSNLGMLYASGQGVTKNVFLSERMLHTAANLGDGDAQFNLAVLLSDEKRLQKHEYMVAKYYALAAFNQNPLAIHNLAEIYLNGIGVKKDQRLALNLYKISCAEGIRQSCDKLRPMVRDAMAKMSKQHQIDLATLPSIRDGDVPHLPPTMADTLREHDPSLLFFLSLS